ncbi:MAG TPA: ABC transporter permease, partial [Polyangiaceae bacterium]|nr:ABC transporter permease [Polyangiaceae bacterium]
MSEHARFAAVTQLALMRLRLFYREPAVLFATFGLPLLISLVVGLAFGDPTPGPLPVAIDAAAAPAARVERGLALLAADPALRPVRLAGPEADAALRAGEVSLVVAPTERGYRYRYDPASPDARAARALVDGALQRGEGRADAFAAGDERASAPGSRYIDFLVPGLLGLSLLSSGLWGFGFALTEMRTKRLLKRLVATPMRRADLLLAFLAVRLVQLAADLPLLLGFARLAFDVRVRGSLAAVAAIAAVGALTFATMGLLLAARTDNAQVVSGLINVASYPMYLCSGV